MNELKKMTIKHFINFKINNYLMTAQICDTTKYLPVYKANYRSKMSMAWHEISKVYTTISHIQINHSFKALNVFARVGVLVEKLNPC